MKTNLLLVLVRERTWFLVTIVFVLLAFIMSATGVLPVPVVEIKWPEVSAELPENLYAPAHELVTGTELVMVYIGSSTCGFCNDPELPSMVESAKLGLQRKASNRGLLFSAIGVSVDWVVRDGSAHLAKFGIFDEIMTGRKWQGTGPHLYFSRIPGEAATPQILVFTREVEGASPEYPARRNRVSDGTLVVRIIGLQGIRHWLERELPMPQNRIQGAVFDHDT